MRQGSKHLPSLKQPVVGNEPVTGCLVLSECELSYSKGCTLERSARLPSSYRLNLRGRTFQTLVSNETIRWGIINWRSLTGHAHAHDHAFSLYSLLEAQGCIDAALIANGKYVMSVTSFCIGKSASNCHISRCPRDMNVLPSRFPFLRFYTTSQPFTVYSHRSKAVIFRYP